MMIRWGRALTEPQPGGQQRIRWGRSAADGTTLVVRVRWGRGASVGAAAVVVAPIADMAAVEPETPLAVTARLAGGGAADSWTWRRVSGAEITILGTGPSITFAAPSNINGTSVTVGVRATVGATQSPEETFTVAVLPQTEWWWGGVGNGWIPRVEEWTA